MGVSFFLSYFFIAALIWVVGGVAIGLAIIKKDKYELLKLLYFWLVVGVIIVSFIGVKGG